MLKIEEDANAPGAGEDAVRLAGCRKDTEVYAALGRPDLNVIKSHMPVFSRDGYPLGTVDCLVGGCIKLTRRDSQDGLHHFVPTNRIERIEDKIPLSKNAKEARLEWDSSIG